MCLSTWSYRSMKISTVWKFHLSLHSLKEHLKHARADNACTALQVRLLLRWQNWDWTLQMLSQKAMLRQGPGDRRICSQEIRCVQGPGSLPVHAQPMQHTSTQRPYTL